MARAEISMWILISFISSMGSWDRVADTVSISRFCKWKVVNIKNMVITWMDITLCKLREIISSFVSIFP
jgi:hypothetical protein